MQFCTTVSECMVAICKSEISFRTYADINKWQYQNSCITVSVSVSVKSATTKARVVHYLKGRTQTLRFTGISFRCPNARSCPATFREGNTRKWEGFSRKDPALRFQRKFSTRFLFMKHIRQLLSPTNVLYLISYLEHCIWRMRDIFHHLLKTCREI